ncbi:hypothetical protein [Nonomuraea sp. NPDC049784]|uniref:hypothetical protein n=1 Tax=Nonomuraea sp. NPDC049784 TaxID=3154361 RepID=UPI00340FECEF
MVVALATALASGYFAVSGLFAPGDLVPGGEAPGARTYAGYMAARSVVLLGSALWLTVTRSWGPLRLVLGLNGVVQVLDSALGAAEHDMAKTVGPALFAVALFAAAALLNRPADRLSPNPRIR